MGNPLGTSESTGFPDLDALLPRLDRLADLPGEALEGEYTALLGRKQGALTTALRVVPGLPLDDRKRFGAAVNALKERFEEAFRHRREALAAERRAAARAGLDLSMPARHAWAGAAHPIGQVLDELVGIFRELGFAVALGPEVETDWYNFLALNFPADHPAMDLHDTLYLALPPVEERAGSGRLLLRTHTSPVQIRVLQASPPPVRVVIPGMVYRSDAFDPSHAPAFQQLEGLAVDEGISFIDLKATLTHFARRFFGAARAVRFRPSYFPFTEPSAEMDVQCGVCGGSGCAACKQTGWMEILGCGMVHPNVLVQGGVDPERYTGFAFGMGPARIAMNRYGVPDIRMLYEGDMRVLRQFRR